MTECCCENKSVKLLYPCSGGADVGELADRVARNLAQEGYGKMSCLAGVGADISGFIASGRDAQQNITIDGCPLRCASKNLQKCDIEAYSLVLTDMGFEKGKTEIDEQTIETAIEILKKELKKETTSSTCCCK